VDDQLALRVTALVAFGTPEEGLDAGAIYLL
jgi:hypothetical protein